MSNPPPPAQPPSASVVDPHSGTIPGAANAAVSPQVGESYDGANNVLTMYVPTQGTVMSFGGVGAGTDSMQNEGGASAGVNLRTGGDFNYSLSGRLSGYVNGITNLHNVGAVTINNDDTKEEHTTGNHEIHNEATKEEHTKDTWYNKRASNSVEIVAGFSSETFIGVKHSTIIGGEYKSIDKFVIETVVGVETKKTVGKVTETVTGTETKSVTGPVTLVVKGPKTKTVNGSVTETINGGPEKKTINGNATETINGAEDKKIDGNVTSKVSGIKTSTIDGEVHIKGNVVKWQAAAKAGIECANANIEGSSKTKIKASTLKLAGEASAEIKGALAEFGGKLIKWGCG